jgi:hypothetical protein
MYQETKHPFSSQFQSWNRFDSFQPFLPNAGSKRSKRSGCSNHPSTSASVVGRVICYSEENLQPPINVCFLNKTENLCCRAAAPKIADDTGCTLSCVSESGTAFEVNLPASCNRDLVAYWCRGRDD